MPWAVRAAQLRLHSLVLAAQELGTLLGVAPDKAESIAADMINDGRLAGRIDQVRPGLAQGA